MKYPVPPSSSLPPAWQSVSLDAGPCCEEKNPSSDKCIRRYFQFFPMGTDSL